MSKQRIGTALLAILLLSIFWIAPSRVKAQGGWSEPFRLSSELGKASEGYLVSDQYGYVHSFWTETLFEDGSTVIKYSRFDGTTWTKPNDIYVTGPGIRNVSTFVDQKGLLYIAWAEGLAGPAYFTYAPANDAMSAQDWAKPQQINVPARFVFMRVDSQDVYHIMYIDQTEDAGVYYIRSEDKGLTWSKPLWIDPDIRPGAIPDSLSFEIDENDGLHAAWFYGSRTLRGEPDWVRYVHSLDGGRTWSEPFTIDKYIPGSDHNLTNASPVMIVQGQTVHIIWAAGSQPYRNHRYSTDAGLTWSTPAQIFGELHGQAFDGFAVDGKGRVHFFAQIRYPMGIYHAYWDRDHWSVPSLVYLIAEEGDEIVNRIHAHHAHPVVRAGNQLVLTFADGPAEPNRRLFVMYRTLEDIPAIQNMPTPSPTASLVPISSPTPGLPTQMPTQTIIAPTLDASDVQNIPAPDFAIRMALIPTLIILGATLTFQLFYKRRR